jgi:hypothetical protein
MHWLRNLALPALFALFALASPTLAQNADPFEQAVQGSSKPVPDGVPSVSPDSLVKGSESPDALDTEASSPDATLGHAGNSDAILGHAENPDALATGSEDISDLPAASAIDQAPASIAPAPPLPGDCTQPAGDAGWKTCLSAVQGQLSSARTRLETAEAAYSRSITLHVPTGAARLAIIEEKDAASADVASLGSTLASQVEQARQSGVSPWVIEPYRQQTED